MSGDRVTMLMLYKKSGAALLWSPVLCSIIINDHSHWMLCKSRNFNYENPGISIMKIHEFQSWKSTDFSHENPRISVMKIHRFQSWKSTNFSHKKQINFNKLRYAVLGNGTGTIHSTFKIPINQSLDKHTPLHAEGLTKLRSATCNE